jgi:predicted cation transporter
MNAPEAAILLVALLFGPVIFSPIEHNLEVYCLALGVFAVTVGRQWEWGLLARVAYDPLPITLAVIAAGLLFRWSREVLDRGFARMREVLARPLLTALTVFLIALLSSCITAIVAALVLVEAVGLLQVAGNTRINVTVAASFAIGLGAALTPIGEPLATLVASALDLRFYELFQMLAPWTLPGIVGMSILAGFFARGDYDLAEEELAVRESVLAILWQGAKVFAFVAGLILISEAYAPLAKRVLPYLTIEALFWINTVSAALDNATLVALEIHGMTTERALYVLLSLLVSGGMLIPGNIPNVVSAGILRIRSAEWARVAIPLGLVMLGIYFAALKLYN